LPVDRQIQEGLDGTDVITASPRSLFERRPRRCMWQPDAIWM